LLRRHTDVQVPEPTQHARGPGRVLVIEDDEHLREVMEVLLSIEGCEARSAQDGGEALAIVRTWHPDLILLDLYMPGMDGRAFLTTYRQMDEPQAPVILLTGRPQTEEELRELGVDGQISKPFNVPDLLDLVAQFTDCSHDE